MYRLREFLEKGGIICLQREADSQTNTILRTNRSIDHRAASQLLEEFDARFPACVEETRLIRLTGPRLADCLSGTIAHIRYLGSQKSLKTMEDYTCTCTYTIIYTALVLTLHLDLDLDLHLYCTSPALTFVLHQHPSPPRHLHLHLYLHLHLHLHCTAPALTLTLTSIPAFTLHLHLHLYLYYNIYI